MKRAIQILSVALIAVITYSQPARAWRPVGEFTFGGGMLYPQGSYDAFSKSNPIILVKGDLHCPGALSLAAVSHFGLTWLNTGHPVMVEYEGAMRQGTWDEMIMTWHLGMQVGSPSQRSLLRFRTAALAGIYWLDYSYKFASASGEKLEVNDGFLKFGWRLNAGVDVYFLKGMALSLDFVWDRVNRAHSVWSQDQLGNWHQTLSPAHLNTYMIGLVVPFSKIWPADKKKQPGSLMP